MFCFATIALRAMMDFKMCAARNMCPTRARRAGGSRAIARLRARTLRGLHSSYNRVPRVGRTNTTPKCKKCFSPKLVAHNGDYVQFRCAKFNIIDPILCALFRTSVGGCRPHRKTFLSIKAIVFIRPTPTIKIISQKTIK